MEASRPSLGPELDPSSSRDVSNIKVGIRLASDTSVGTLSLAVDLVHSLDVREVVPVVGSNNIAWVGGYPAKVVVPDRPPLSRVAANLIPEKGSRVTHTVVDQ
jgi:hypothetical protein